MGKCKFNNLWLDRTDDNNFKISVWCKKHGDYELFCMCCSSVVSVDKKGFQALIQHANTAKHIKLCKDAYGQNQTHLLSSDASGSNKASSLQLVTTKESAHIAEILWVLKLVCSNYSFSSTEGIAELFVSMFPDSVIAKDFLLSPSKVHYLLNHALCPYFREQMIDDAQQSFYSISYDETTNVESKKELIITLTFWSERKNRVISRHLQTYMIGKADAQTLLKHIKNAIDTAGLSLNKLVTVGCDGPNVNKKLITLMNEEVKYVRKSSLVDIGTCNIHIVHNAFLHGLQCFGEEASELVTIIYLYFDGWPARFEDYQAIQKELGLSQNKFIKHSSSRWLTFKPAAERLLEQWKGIKHYFLKHIPSKNSQAMQSSSCKKIAQYLRQPSMKAQILFTISSASVFTKFTSKFQSDDPQIHTLYTDLMNLILCIAGRVCVSQELAYTLDESQIFGDKNLLPLTDIVLNSEIRKEIDVLRENEKLYLLKNIQNHYVKAGKHLLQKSSVKSKILKALKCLSPENISSSSSSDIVYVARTLPLDVAEDMLVDEWKLLCLEDLEVKKEMKINEFWYAMFSATALDAKKFPTITIVVKAALSLPHGNADIERRFSVSRWALTEDRAAMSEKTLNSLMIVKDELRLYNQQPHMVPITKKLISCAVSARKRYVEFLEDEKKKENMKRKMIEEEQKLKEEEQKRRKLMERDRKNIDKLSAELKEKTEEYSQSRELTAKLLSEATERLNRAVKNKDLKEVNLANVMLQGVKKLQDEETVKHEEVSHLQKDVERRKNGLITFFTKNKNLNLPKVNVPM